MVGKSEEITLSWNEDISKPDVDSQPVTGPTKDEKYVHSK